MIRNIFVPINGKAANDGVFATALAVARPLAAHLEFFHLRYSPCVAAVRTRHVEYCVGTEINLALEALRRQDQESSEDASKNFADFCEQNVVAVRSAPTTPAVLCANLLQETDQAEARLLFHAQHSDLVVIGRPQDTDPTPYGLIETLLLSSGRPVIIAPVSPPATVTDTVMVGWRDSPEAVRSVASSIPLLKLARRVVLVHIHQGRHTASDTLDGLRRNLAWHGIIVEVRYIPQHSKPALQLQQIAVDESASLLVIGGYSHRPMAEAVFGGVSRTFIEAANVPVFLMH